MSLDFLSIVVAGFAAFLLIDLGCFWLRSHELERPVQARSAADRRRRQAGRVGH